MKYKKYLSIILGLFSILSLVAFTFVSSNNREEEAVLVLLSMFILLLSILCVVLGIISGIQTIVKGNIVLGILGLLTCLIIPLFFVLAIAVNAKDILKLLAN
ncbi:hypothetical protein [Aquimarina sp. 2201CG14-23]|uniref:hypothetical protein n=1 Tax=Aquimarina mycalae TaxID=3040073 RepID=UPI002478278D|nr:hypothetical protein [Aquimarina sp. 2201CG14-23]MDH7445244.1 hypothetical protein [Aquimarina sp. 2201CG14-23]